MNSIQNTPISPYRDSSLNKIYNLLFCDTIDLYKTESQSSEYPWDTLLSDNPEPGQLAAIASDESLETRQQILAYNLLLAKGFPINTKELLGVIIEVPLADGLDVLAAFNDGTCRYINHAEKLLVWDTQTNESSHLVNQLFSDSLAVVSKIGPWEQERTPFPGEGMIKMTFLVSDGLYFGQGPFGALQADPMAGPIINSAIRLMSYLIDHTA
ncbi:hypothetical protein [Spirosoma validum]|uniref:Uncharacterized protein n=1 Tax=Spirosoma validum TaxID=2771355 RepID=A0A927GFZ8_9BACT|nr:hypothetical protein [Spirosoma validum]MBD2756354.1 hypothetical protein [Spirosoma validum]